MKRQAFSFLVFFLLCAAAGFAQNKLDVKVADSLTHEGLPGVGVIMQGANVSAVTDVNGNAMLKNIPDGNFRLTFSYLGYRTKEISLTFPDASRKEPLPVMLAPMEQVMEEVVISTTRTNSHVEDIPLKVEVIGQDDTEEENGIKPGNVSSLLGDVSGIQLQQTSATSGNTNVRIQGLGGKYTQVLRDGIPQYEGFSADFGVMQLPPLDIRQIEIVKGSASTLYGGGAIAGIINLISKDPSATRNASATMNYSSLTERNFNAFVSQRFKKTGYTFFTGFTRQDAVDVDKDGFSDVPDINYITLHPKLYHYFNEKTKLVLGLSGVYEKRSGGDMQVLLHGADSLHRFFETNESWRGNADLLFSSEGKNKNTFNVKASGGLFDRSVSRSDYVFAGTQYNFYSEISYLIPREHYDLVMGLNVISDYFQATRTKNALLNTFSNATAGLFVQHTWRIHKKLVLESGLRADEHSRFGTFVLPRLALLYRFNQAFSSRLNAGLGYKTPNVFSKQFEEYNPNTLLPLTDSVKAEHSVGGSFELIGKKVSENGFSVFADQSFFYTEIDEPVIPAENRYGEIYLTNAGKPVVSAGSDTYVRLSKEDFELYLGYTYTHAQQRYDTVIRTMPLYPAHRFAATAYYSTEDAWRCGVEASWFGSQYTPDGEKKPGYLFMAAMIGRVMGNITAVLNCENLLDYRQNKVERVVIPPYSNPSFRTLWAPIDGRVVNLSVRMKF